MTVTTILEVPSWNTIVICTWECKWRYTWQKVFPNMGHLHECFTVQRIWNGVTHVYTVGHLKNVLCDQLTISMTGVDSRWHPCVYVPYFNLWDCMECDIFLWSMISLYISPITYIQVRSFTWHMIYTKFLNMIATNTPHVSHLNYRPERLKHALTGNTVNAVFKSKFAKLAGYATMCSMGGDIYRQWVWQCQYNKNLKFLCLWGISILITNHKSAAYLQCMTSLNHRISLLVPNYITLTGQVYVFQTPK